MRISSDERVQRIVQASTHVSVCWSVNYGRYTLLRSDGEIQGYHWHRPGELEMWLTPSLTSNQRAWKLVSFRSWEAWMQCVKTLRESR